MDVQQAAQAYRLAVATAMQHQEAATLAAQLVAPARTNLAAIDPNHALLQLQPADLASLQLLHPLQMLVEVFLTSRNIPQASPSTLLLAGSLALPQTGPGTASATEILRRIMAQSRNPISLER